MKKIIPMIIIAALFLCGCSEMNTEGTSGSETVPTLEATATPEPTATPTPTVAPTPTEIADPTPAIREYYCNNGTMKFHLKRCSSVDTIKEDNLVIIEGTRDEIIEKGYSPCGKCNP